MIENLMNFLVKSMVDDPDKVDITVKTDEKGYIVKVVVADEDIGKVIGKRGHIATAIRAIAKASASKEKKAVKIDFSSISESKEA